MIGAAVLAPLDQRQSYPRRAPLWRCLRPMLLATTALSMPLLSSA
ncbi:MAG: hypothetical protein AAFR88_13165 [Pseudomonadota bacterium]